MDQLIEVYNRMIESSSDPTPQTCRHSFWFNEPSRAGQNERQASFSRRVATLGRFAVPAALALTRYYPLKGPS